MSDLLLRNARISTGEPAAPWANAALVRDGRFAFVGDERDVSPPTGTPELDAGGRLVVPGFTDGHAHLVQTGYAMTDVRLKALPSAAAAAALVRERAARTPHGAWIRGAGWDQNDWPGARFPHRRDLDAAAPEHPVVLAHTSGHCVWVNTMALRLAGITAATPAPFGGAIDIGDDGEPTGILRDTAARLVSDVIPSPTPDERLAAFRNAIEHAHSLGVTGAHAMDVGRGEYQAMLALRDSGRLRLRIRAYLTAGRLDEWIDRAVRTGDGDEMMRVGGVKFFADGALGSMTAWMFEPFDDAPGTGLALQPAHELEASVRRCLDHGLDAAIHAIGDRANHEVLGIIERTRAIAPELPRRIEHAQLLRPDDIARFAALGVTASVQPIHATQDMAKVERSWGTRGRYAYAFASLAATGANLAFGSDTPVETMDPIAGLHAAVTRRNAAGVPDAGWYPEERIGVEAALAAYTRGCARAAGDEATLGSIAAGKHADFVVLSHDIIGGTDSMRILQAQPDITVVGGDVVFRRAEAEA